MDLTNFPVLFLIGVFLLIGWSADVIGNFLKLPRVTLILVAGLMCGPSFLNVFPHQVADWFPDVAQIALAMVGFLLGTSFIGHDLKNRGRSIIGISLGKTIVAAGLVFVAVYAVSQNLVASLLLAGIAPASAPAATFDVIHEAESKGPLTDTILGIVAIDDIWGVSLFSVLLVFTETISGQGHASGELLKGLLEIGGAVLIGTIIGFPMAWLTGRVKTGEPTLLEASGFVFLCGGLAIYFDVSYLIACMVLGGIVANFAKHHTRPFHEIENASSPFLVIFFLLAGYEFDLASFKTMGLLGLVYVIARCIGFIVGGYSAAKLVGESDIIKKHIGWCLLPQAGVALGLALLAMERFPEIGQHILPLIIGTTIVFELIGPVITRRHLNQAGEC